MKKRDNIQSLLDSADKAKVNEDSAEFDKACQKLGLEMYRRSLRKSTYKIIVENPRR